MNTKRVILLMALVTTSLAPLEAEDTPQGFFLRDGDRLVFYGDSITDSEWYPTLVQTFVATRFPKWRNEFYNRGQSGDNSGSLARFARDVATLKPQALTYMMGYNDGGYAPLKPETVSRFLENVSESVRIARGANPRMRIMLIGPTPNETAVSSAYPRWVTGDFYPYCLLTLGREEGRLAQRLGVGYVDMTTLYGQTLGFGRVLAGKTFALSRDGVHPQQEGQTFIAYHLLKAMGAPAQVAQVEIDAAKGKVTRAERCQVSALRTEGGRLSFRRVCESLPYPTPLVARPFALLVDLDNTINADVLVVQGLTAPSYALSVDGEKIAELPAEALAEGVNLSAYPATPMYRQALALMEAVRKKDLLDCAFWRQYVTTGKAEGAGNPLGTDPAARAEVEAARKEIAEAREAIYALNTPRAHTITLEPLEKEISRYADRANADLNQGFLICGASKVDVDWNTMKLRSDRVEVQVQNPGTREQEVTITWHCPAGWQVTPAQGGFAVAGGKTQKQAFAISCPGGQVTLPPPTATVRWAWAQDWAYPMQREVELELTPHLTIARAKTAVTVDGNLDDWADATGFALANVYFMDMAVPGKRELWNGPEDLSARIMMKWDEQALYVAALVRDASHVQNQPANMMWSQDMVQLAALAEAPGKPAGRYEWGFGVYEGDRSEIAYYSAQAAEAADIQFQGHVNDFRNWCAYEIAIPWGRLAPLVPAAGKTLRLTVTIGEADPVPGKGYNYLAWTHGIAYGKNSADFAVVTLGE